MAAPEAAPPAPNRVYVHNLPWDLSNEELAGHMNAAGTVRYASIMTLNDGRSKGCGIVEYSTLEEAQNAMATLHNSELKGRPILVREDRGQQARTADGGRGRGRGAGAVGRGGRGGSFAASGAPAHAAAGYGGYEGAAPRGGRGGGRGGAPRGGFEGGAPRAPRAPRVPGAGEAPRGTPGTSVWVGNLAWDVSWQELKDAFASFNPTYTDVKMGSDGRSRGWGVVRFADVEGANAAISAMNGAEIHDRAIQVREDTGGHGPREA